MKQPNMPKRGGTKKVNAPNRAWSTRRYREGATLAPVQIGRNHLEGEGRTLASVQKWAESRKYLHVCQKYFEIMYQIIYISDSIFKKFYQNFNVTFIFTQIFSYITQNSKWNYFLKND
jgi:hypothetical protein